MQITKKASFKSSVIPVLLEDLGVPDSAKRENALDTLWNSINSGSYSSSDLISLGNNLVENLFEELGKEVPDSVFRRTFSAILLGVIVSKDQFLFESGKAAFIDELIFRSWFDASISYYEAETDLRGFIPGKGWAHAISHGADLLRDLSFHRYTGRSEHLRMLEALRLQFFRFRCEPLNNNDDNRIARFILTVLLRGEISPGDFEKWLDSLSIQLKGGSWLDVSESPGESMVFFNIVTALRAIYLSFEFGIKKLKDSALYEKSTPYSEELKQLLRNCLLKLDAGLNYAPY